MNTSQIYVGRDCYANQATSYTQKITQRVKSIALLSGLSESEVWLNLFNLLECYYNVDIYALPKLSEGECLLTVAERYDLLDRLLLIAQAEELHYLPF